MTDTVAEIMSDVQDIDARTQASLEHLQREEESLRGIGERFQDRIEAGEDDERQDALDLAEGAAEFAEQEKRVGEGR